MWKKFLKQMKSRWMSARMLCSYLALLAAPLAAILIFYFYTNRALLDVQYEKSYRLQAEAVNHLEQQLSDVHNLSVYLLQEPKITRFNQPYESKTEEFWEKYQYAQSVPDYSLFNQMIDHVYILSKKSRYIIQIPAVIPTTRLGYQTVNQFEFSDYEEQLESFCCRDTYGDLMYMKCADGRDCVTMLHSIKNGKSIDGVIAVTLKNSVINSALSSCNPSNHSFTAILDADGVILRTVSGKDSELDPGFLETADLAEGYSIADIGGESCLINVHASSVQSGWYLTATPLWVLTREISGMRIWLVLLSCIAAVISLTLCTAYWHKRRDVVDLCRDFREQQERHGYACSPAEQTNFWSGIRDVFHYVDRLQRDLADQKTQLEEQLTALEELKGTLVGQNSALQRETSQEVIPTEAADTPVTGQKAALEQYLNEHYSSPCFNLAELAQAFGVSESKMYKDFRLYFGCSFTEQLERTRMTKACELLLEGMSVKEVTARTGYGSDVSFRRAFKRLTGLAPSEWVSDRANCGENPVKM